MYHYKKLYTYTCVDCGKTRQTTKESRLEEELVCRPCLNRRVPEGQQSLFGSVDDWKPND